MSNFFNIMAAPFAECLVLVGIHAYLGIHVLKRRIIFVDLALAQIAALGTTVGILFGIVDTNSVASFGMAMGFTFVGAGVFAISRMRNRRIPQEAVIGLVYAITAAVAVLVVGKIRGVEHLVNVTHGRLLWVQWSEVGVAAVAYLLIGVVHFIFRKRFFQISEDPDGAFKTGVNVRLWDFFFYMTFGYVISFSVPVAGVLLVFVFLVAPAIISMMVSNQFKVQLAVGWISGTIVCVLGIYLSWTMDTPSGPTVVATYAAVLLFIAVALYLIRAEQRGKALARVGVGAVTLGVLSLLFYGGGTFLAGTRLAESKYGHHQHHHDMPATVEGETEDHDGHDHGDHDHGDHGHAAHEAPASAAAATPPPAEEPAAAQPAGADALVTQYKEAETCLDRVDVLSELLEQERSTGLELTYVFLFDGETMPFCRNGALDLIKAQAGHDFGLDPDADPVDSREALQRLRQWIDAGAAPPETQS